MNAAQLKNKRADILAIASAHGASNVRVFGSVLDPVARQTHDVDFLVDLAPERTLLDQAGLSQALAEFLGCPVDVVAADSLHWLLRRRILGEAEPL